MSTLAIDDFGARIQALRPGTAHTLPIAAESHATPPLNLATGVIRVSATTACFIAFGPAPVADSAGGHHVIPGIPEYFRVLPGERIAVIRESVDGQLHLSEML